jgi:hypothetical protein
VLIDRPSLHREPRDAVILVALWATAPPGRVARGDVPERLAARAGAARVLPAFHVAHHGDGIAPGQITQRPADRLAQEGSSDAIDGAMQA